jgi:hypothetical protein
MDLIVLNILGLAECDRAGGVMVSPGAQFLAGAPRGCDRNDVESAKPSPPLVQPLKACAAVRAWYFAAMKSLLTLFTALLAVSVTPYAPAAPPTCGRRLFNRKERKERRKK